MVEYGQGVGQSTEVAGGGGGSGGASMDVGTMIGDAVDRVAALPPEVLLILAVALVAGFIFFKRAF